MPEMSDRTASRLEPEPGWTIVTEAPLKGLWPSRVRPAEFLPGMREISFTC